MVKVSEKFFSSGDILVPEPNGNLNSILVIIATFSADIKVKIIRLKPVLLGTRGRRPGQTNLSLIYDFKNIREKLSVIR